MLTRLEKQAVLYVLTHLKRFRNKLTTYLEDDLVADTRQRLHFLNDGACQVISDSLTNYKDLYPRIKEQSPGFSNEVIQVAYQHMYRHYGHVSYPIPSPVPKYTNSQFYHIARAFVKNGDLPKDVEREDIRVYIQGRITLVDQFILEISIAFTLVEID